ncbi:restriction endonuclease [Streptomyces sp. G-G2]|uniref:restriction endonuclease n=1 Tax=Streptomyces sp. G-G2 TaxID=3046201 RepID=UPI0024BBB288|nr:restriction endonuclease [Streptomyces sp. G-G2]MDJ0380401.1 restriction endonuclease [Streptomyces sp. G-G2]
MEQRRTRNGQGGYRGRSRSRAAAVGRDVVLAVGLVGICVGGLAAFVKAVGGDGTRIPVLPVVVVVVIVIGTALAKWSLSQGSRRSLADPFAYPQADPLAYPQADPLPPPEAPGVGATALDHEAVDADGFEHTVAALCARDGCSPVEVVGGAGDLGADVIATTPDGLRLVVQCKHYGENNRVGSQDLQRFGGTCFAVHDADVAVVVTTSSFTAPALEYAATCGIVCLDGDALAAWTETAVPPPWEAAGEPSAGPAAATVGASPHDPAAEPTGIPLWEPAGAPLDTSAVAPRG